MKQISEYSLWSHKCTVNLHQRNSQFYCFQLHNFLFQLWLLQSSYNSTCSAVLYVCDYGVLLLFICFNM